VNAESPAQQEPKASGGSETVAKPEGDIRIELKFSRNTFKQGEKEKYMMELVNQGTSNVTLVKPGDGSAHGWRTPVITWQLDGKVYKVARCGNINALEADEVIVLKSGERRTFHGWVSGPYVDKLPPGVHRLSVEYDHRPDMKWRGIPLGEHDPETMKRIREIKPLKAVS